MTQLQTLLQNQTSVFGKHIFQNGSRVSGANQVRQIATYLKLDSNYSNIAISANNFNGKTIYSTDGTKRAQVLVSYDVDKGTGDPATLMIKQLYGDPFVAGETIKTEDNAFANVATGGVGTGLTFSIDEGYWFYEGFFVKNLAQTIAVSKYSINANSRIGFNVTENILTSSDDTTLLDPALEASNYQAPGADRFAIELNLAQKDYLSTDRTQFIEVGKFYNGNYFTSVQLSEYAGLADEFAHRTYDQSGNYTVNAFNLNLTDNSSNTAQTSVILSPGKAYVYGYEVSTSLPTTINVDKPRDTFSVNGILSADYGEYIYTKNHYGSFPIDSLSKIDVHCVSRANVNTSSVAALSNTKIGTVRVKSYDYDSSSNTSNSKTYTYRTSIFDVNINNSITGNVNTAPTTTSVTIGNVSAGQFYSSVDNAYAGAIFTITTGPGSTEGSKIITSFNAATQTITFSAADAYVATLNTSSKFIIDFEFSSAESFIVNSSTTIVSSADIDSRSQDPASTYNYSFISATSLEPLIFKLGQDWIANNSITNMKYYYKKLYTSVNFSSNSATITVPDPVNESFIQASLDSSELMNYQIICTTASGAHTVGQIVTSANLSVTTGTGTATLTVANSNSMVANVIATIYTPNAVAKSKTYITCNPCVQTSANISTANVDSGAAIIYGSNGQVTIANTSVIKTPGTPQSLYVADVDKIVQILDFNGASVSNTGGIDVTTKYSFDNGQRDSYYDHSSIILKSGVTAPKGPLVVRYNGYVSSGSGFATNYSYIPNYNIIPSYTSRSGITYNLRDCLDFRPVRANAVGSFSSTSFSFNLTPSTGPKIPEMGTSIISSYSYYLPRTDLIVIHKNKIFEVIKGISSLTPQDPKVPNDAMVLYVLHNPAYVANTSVISVQYIDNKRYTMRDIGTLEKRISNLEYYTSLSLLEQDTLGKQDLTVLDSTNLPRFKNGILTDSFTGSSVADITNDSYKASIDSTNKEMRPTFNITSFGLTYDTVSSPDCVQSGPFVLLSSQNSKILITQSYASDLINLNPFNVVKYLGKISLSPSSDIWVDTNRAADVLVNLSGDHDAWEMITNNLPVSTQWGSWNDIFFGQPQTNTQQWSSGWTTYTQTNTTQSVTQQKQGITTSVVPQTITQNIGDRVVNVAIIPYIRASQVMFYGSNFKPVTKMYGFFDSQSVDNYIARANRFVLDNSSKFSCRVGNPENINVTNTITNTVNVVSSIQNSSNSVFTLNINGVPGGSFKANTIITGQYSNYSANVIGYYHYSGNVVSATTNTIVISKDASGSNNEIYYANVANSNVVNIVFGTGAGQTATMSSYNAGTRTITISGTWTTIPDSTSIYSIGQSTTDSAGNISGLFYLPGATFKIGERTFQLIDNNTNNILTSSTNGETSYFAQGTLQTMQKETVTTVAPTVERYSVTATQNIVKTLDSSTTAVDNTPTYYGYGGGASGGPDDGGADGGGDNDGGGGDGGDDDD